MSENQVDTLKDAIWLKKGVTLFSKRWYLMWSCVALPLAARALPLAARALPLAARALPLAARALPLAARALPLAARALPLAARALPLAARALPLAARALPLAARALPLAARALPLAARALPLAARALPLAARALPLAARALTTILSGLTTGLLSGGINKVISGSVLEMEKHDKCYWVQKRQWSLSSYTSMNVMDCPGNMVMISVVLVCWWEITVCLRIFLFCNYLQDVYKTKVLRLSSLSLAFIVEQYGLMYLEAV